MLTFAQVRSQQFGKLNQKQKKQVSRHPRLSDKIHAFTMKKAAEMGTKAVMADTGGFIQSILSALAGSLLPVIGPLLINIIAPMVIKWIQDMLQNIKAGDESVDDLLTRISADAVYPVVGMPGLWEDA